MVRSSIRSNEEFRTGEKNIYLKSLIFHKWNSFLENTDFKKTFSAPEWINWGGGERNKKGGKMNAHVRGMIVKILVGIRFMLLYLADQNVSIISSVGTSVADGPY